MSSQAVVDPGGILGDIARHKHSELAARFAGVTLDALRASAVPATRSLAAAMGRRGARFILEVKKASPSQGAIRGDADPAAIARGFAGVADALSVLTDRTFFGGTSDDLTAAREGFGGPILAKDFFIDTRQVVEARIAGADAVLVMLSLLDDAQARAIIAEAHRFHMEVLVEVHDEPQLRRALALDAPLIGINNRDLRDLSIDLSTTERLAPLAPGRLLVSESGIEGRRDVERLAPLVNGFLVGTSLMRAREPAQAARQLMFGRVKLCGLNRPEDVRAAKPAAFAGFVFVPGTARDISAEAALPLARLAQASGLHSVGVFRDAPLALVGEIATRLDLHAVQLHGREDAAYVRALRHQLPAGCEVWTAVDMGREGVIERGGDRLLFDNGGGSGQPFDWSRIERHPQLAQAIVAGGIGPANARRAASLGAFAIDVGSAVDRAPGVKSPELIGTLFDSLRPASRQEYRACA